MRTAGALFALIAAFAPLASFAAPVESPRPVLRPDSTVVLPASDLPASRPQPRPDAAPVAEQSPLATVRPQPRPVIAPPETLQPVAALPMPRLSAPGQLGKAAICGIPGLSGRKIPPITSRVSGCGLADGVEVTAVSGIPLSVPVQIDCTTAAALKTWVDRGIVPVIGNRGGGVARLEIAGSYACRPRNNQAGAKVSEHGRGRAVDLSAIRLRSGEVMSVENDWRGLSGAMLRRVHASACGPFGTVLGPQSDRFHHDHIHVDTARNRAGAYCR